PLTDAGSVAGAGTVTRLPRNRTATTGTAIRRTTVTTTASTATISSTVSTAASATVGVPAAALTRVGLRGREHREQLHRRPVHGAVRVAGAHVPALLPRLGER